MDLPQIVVSSKFRNKEFIEHISTKPSGPSADICQKCNAEGTNGRWYCDKCENFINVCYPCLQGQLLNKLLQN